MTARESRRWRGAWPVGLLVLLVAAAWPADRHARAQEAPDGDRVTVAVASALMGEQFRMRLEVLAAPGAEVEIDPAAPGWSGVQVIRIESRESLPEGDRVRHVFEVIVAGFLPGTHAVAPTMVEIAGGLGTPRTLPPVELQVLSTLAAGAPLELRPLDGPQPIAGAESFWLRPAIAAGALLALALLLAVIVFALRRWARRRPLDEAGEDDREPAPPDGLGGAERLLDADPVGAYRALAAAVRQVISQRYGLPAAALTTRELRRRMEDDAEVDRWQARLVGGLLEECDAVVYAGYLPAAERRRADFAMAREIVEAAT